MSLLFLIWLYYHTVLSTWSTHKKKSDQDLQMSCSAIIWVCTWAGGPGCGARWRLEPPPRSSQSGFCRWSCLEMTTCHPAAPGSPLTEGSEPEPSSTLPPDSKRKYTSLHTKSTKIALCIFLISLDLISTSSTSVHVAELSNCIHTL